MFKIIDRKARQMALQKKMSLIYGASTVQRVSHTKFSTKLTVSCTLRQNTIQPYVMMLANRFRTRVSLIWRREVNPANPFLLLIFSLNEHIFILYLAIYLRLILPFIGMVDLR